MRKDRTSRTCLMLVPLLVVCLLAVGGGRAYAYWDGILHLWPGPNIYDADYDEDDHDTWRDICGRWQGYYDDGYGQGWPNASEQWDWEQLVDDDSGSHYSISSWGNTFNVYMTDAYVANHSGDWSNAYPYQYKRQVTVVWKFPSIYGGATMRVEVWHADGSPAECGPDHQDPPPPGPVDTIADLVDTYSVGITGPTDWVADDDIKSGAGDDPEGDCGTILRVKGYVNNAGRVWVDSVDVYYSKWVQQ